MAPHAKKKVFVLMASWKGLILAGGTGSRLAPLTQVVNKHLLPVYDKPMIYYPLTTLMMSGVREFVIVSMPQMLPQFEQLLGTGEALGIKITYAAQAEPKGIAHGILVAQDHLADSNVALVLGDNIFYGTGLPQQLRQAIATPDMATIFGYQVRDPRRFGVVELDKLGKPIDLVEKPKEPRSNLAVPGLYFYPPDVVSIAAALKPSNRGELEITDVNRVYLEQQRLQVMPMGRGTAWLDGGTHQDLFEAGQFVKVLEERTGLKIACPEEVAFRQGFITAKQLKELLPTPPRNEYESYLLDVATSP
jgi:glucose-1-phosphate thymidylyltransferase